MTDSPTYGDIIEQLIASAQLMVIPAHARVPFICICSTLKGAQQLEPIGSHFIEAGARMNKLWGLGDCRMLINRAELARALGGEEKLTAAVVHAPRVEPTIDGAIELDAYTKAPRRKR